MRPALAACLLLTSTIATADSYNATRGAGTDGWGVVPGYRVGPVHSAFDGTTAAPVKTSVWGHTTELHVDVIKTFGGDRHAYGFSLGYLSQSNDGWFSRSATLATDSYSRAGMALTGILSTVIGDGGANSASARAGLVFGETETTSGTIDAKLWRLGAELTHVSTVMSHFDFATHLSIEYFRGGDGMRSYSALAIVLGETFALGF